MTTKPDKTNECPTCAGKPAFSFYYCDAHNVCIKCGTHRSKLKETPWGSISGAFICAPCAAKETADGIAKRKANPVSHDDTDNVVCPHCFFEYQDCYEMSDGKHQCEECAGSFMLSREFSVTYTTEKEST